MSVYFFWKKAIFFKMEFLTLYAVLKQNIVSKLLCIKKT